MRSLHYNHSPGVTVEGAPDEGEPLEEPLPTAPSPKSGIPLKC